MVVHYLPERLEYGPLDGSNPSRIAVPVRSVSLPVMYLNLEQQLVGVRYRNAQGDDGISIAND